MRKMKDFIEVGANGWRRLVPYAVGGLRMFELVPLTTGEAAKYCHVSQATIVNWIKLGKLSAYSTPGGHYRILLTDFLLFLERHGMPVDPRLKVPVEQ